MLRKDAKVELMKRVPLFSGCSKRELTQIASVADELRDDAGARARHHGSGVPSSPRDVADDPDEGAAEPRGAARARVDLTAPLPPFSVLRLRVSPPPATKRGKP